jgi:hypothetical protein
MRRGDEGHVLCCESLRLATPATEIIGFSAVCHRYRPLRKPLSTSGVLPCTQHRSQPRGSVDPGLAGRIVGRVTPFARVFPSSREVERLVGLVAWAILEGFARDATCR